ncbi:MAG: ABC transporter permease [Natronospirillum sp.]
MIDFLDYFLADNFVLNTRTILHYWDGLVMTVQLVFLALLIGLVLAVPLAIGRTSKKWWISMPIWCYTYVFRGTPLLIQLYIIYYGVTFIDGIQDSPFWFIFREAYVPLLIAFVLNTAAYTTEILRGAIKQTPHGEVEAAQAYGFTPWQVMSRIKLPSALRRALPAYSNEVIFMLHASSIASVVTIIDLTGAARDIFSRYYTPFTAFLFVAAIYLVLTFALVYTFKRLERRYLAHL